MKENPQSAGARRRRAAYRLGTEAGKRAGHIEAINKLAEVAQVLAIKSGEAGLTVAGLLVSALAGKPDLIDRLMIEGADLVMDGTLNDAIRGTTGTLTYRAENGKIIAPVHHRTILEASE